MSGLDDVLIGNQAEGCANRDHLGSGCNPAFSASPVPRPISATTTERRRF